MGSDADPGDRTLLGEDFEEKCGENGTLGKTMLKGPCRGAPDGGREGAGEQGGWNEGTSSWICCVDIRDS